MATGTLYLIPVPLGPGRLAAVLPAEVLEQVRHLRHFVAEHAKSARAFLKLVGGDIPIQHIAIGELNEHTPPEALPPLLTPLLEGHDVGLVSEAGCPAVADPGAALVALAHASDICIYPLVGPSSLLLALMGSGLSGQSFAFHGYLPTKEELLKKRIQTLESESRRERRTQIFIETPYRNARLFQTLLATCASTTRICLATDLSLPSQHIQTHLCRDWQQHSAPDIDKRPTVFLFQA